MTTLTSTSNGTTLDTATATNPILVPNNVSITGADFGLSGNESDSRFLPSER